MRLPFTTLEVEEVVDLITAEDAKERGGVDFHAGTFAAAFRRLRGSIPCFQREISRECGRGLGVTVNMHRDFVTKAVSIVPLSN